MEKISWRAITSGRPTEGPKLEIDNPLSSRRVLMHRDALAGILANESAPSATKRQLQDLGILDSQHYDDQKVKSGATSWKENGWGFSLAPYLWSRSAKFEDVGEGAEDRRVTALKQMISEEPCPTPDAPSGDVISLPTDPEWQSAPLGEIMLERRSTGTFRGGNLDAKTLNTLLRHGTTKLRRCRTDIDPNDVRSLLISVGAAFDVHVIVYGCEGLEAGAYQFVPETCHLVRLKTGDLRKPVMDAFAGQPDVTYADASIVLVSDYRRYRWRYRHERALRNLYVEAGRLMQPLILTATALGLRTGITPALRDSQFPDLLGREVGDWQALHTLTIAKHQDLAGTTSA